MPKSNEFANYIQQNMPQVLGVFQGVIEGIGNAISFVKENIHIIIPILAGALAGFLAFQVLGVIVPLFTAVKAAIVGTTTVQAALNAVMAANPIGLVVTAIGLLVAAGVALWMNWDKVKETCVALFGSLKATWENIKSSIIGTCTGLGDSLKVAWDNMKTTVVEKAQELVSVVPEKFINMGKACVQGIWKGMNDAKDWLKEKVMGLADFLPNWVKERLGIHSPSRVFAEIGKNTMDGLAKGITENQDTAIATMESYSWSSTVRA